MISPASTAYLLVTHGSRDPRSQAGAEQLAAQLRARFGCKPASEQLICKQQARDSEACIAIAHAVLELGPAPLHSQIEQFAHQVAPLGVTTIKLLPLFLLPGVHVREDLPAELAQAQTTLAAQPDTADIALALLPHLGAEAALLPVLKAQQQALLTQLSEQSQLGLEPAPVGSGAEHKTASLSPKPLTIRDVDWALLAHGSRRTGAVQAIADLAHAIGARPAYWVGSPSLTDCVAIQQNRGSEHQLRPLGCLSYFLFAGGITDRLTAQLEAAVAESPAILSAPLGAFPALVDVVAAAMTRSPSP